MTTAQQPAIVDPLAEKRTVPCGMTGVKATPASWAVKVTGVPRVVELEGEAVTPSVGVRAATVRDTALVEDTVKLISPEYVAAI